MTYIVQQANIDIALVHIILSLSDSQLLHVRRKTGAQAEPEGHLCAKVNRVGAYPDEKNVQDCFATRQFLKKTHRPTHGLFPRDGDVR